MQFDLAPLLAAPWHVQVHAMSAMAGFALGAIQLIAPKGTLPHRAIGVVWIVLLTLVTVSSAFIIDRRAPDEPFMAHFSWIHIFTILTAVGLVHGVWFLLRGGPQLKFHRGPFIGIFIGGLVIAGFFAFMPGRIMHAVLFGGDAATLQGLDDPYWYFLPGAEPPG